MKKVFVCIWSFVISLYNDTMFNLGYKSCDGCAGWYKHLGTWIPTTVDTIEPTQLCYDCYSAAITMEQSHVDDIDYKTNPEV